MKLTSLFLLLASALFCAAQVPLKPGVYSGMWMGSPGGFRNGDYVQLVIHTNHIAYITFDARVDPITGTQVTQSVLGEVVGERVVRGGSKGGSASFRASEQRAGRSAQGWIRLKPRGATLRFYAHYQSPPPPDPS